MKTVTKWTRVAGLGLAAWSAGAAQADKVEAPVPMVQQEGIARAESPTPAGQRLYQPGRDLIPAAQVQVVLEGFREAYEALERPRIVIAVNRELVDTAGGLRMTGRDERVSETTTESESTVPAAAGQGPQTQVNVSTGGAVNAGAAGGGWPAGPGQSRATSRTVTADNTYAAAEAPAVTLADRQTTRDVERLFGRPLRIGGVRLADQRVVASLMAERPLGDLLAATGEGARRDRAALEKIADAVIEVLISSRTITLPGFGGAEAQVVPDIQATLIRLADGAILGQASATDVWGRDREAGPVVRNYDVRDIAEATALALMEDIAVTAPRAEP